MSIDSPLSGLVALDLIINLVQAIFRSERFEGEELMTFHRVLHIAPHVGGLIPLINPLGMNE